MDAVSENEGRKHPGVERAYRNEQIVVYWEPKLCIHSANCIRGLRQVFNRVIRKPETKALFYYMGFVQVLAETENASQKKAAYFDGGLADAARELGRFFDD